MNHLRQGPRECYPTALAMLTGEPVEGLKAILVGWTDSADFIDMMDHWDVRNVRKAFADLAEMLGFARPYVDTIIGCPHPDLSGRGIFIVHWTTSGSHAIAYENGILYDPDLEGPRSYEEWFRVHGDFVRLSEVVPLLDRKES